MSRNRFFVLFVLIVLLLVGAVPTLAQDTPSAPAELSKTEIVLIGALFVVVALFAIFGTVIASLASKLLNALPPWAVDIVKSGASTGLTRLEEAVLETPSMADDELAARIRAELERLGLVNPKASSGVVYHKQE